MDLDTIQKHLARLFKKHGKGSQTRALSLIGMTADAFRAARKNRSLRARDLLGILRALGEDPAEFFQAVADETDDGALSDCFLENSLSLSEREERQRLELISLDGLRFDEPFRLLKDLEGLASSIEPVLSWLFHAVSGSCFRLLEQNLQASDHLRRAQALAPSKCCLAEVLRRRAFVHFLEQPRKAINLIERAGYLFHHVGNQQEVRHLLIDRAIVAFHSRAFNETEDLCIRALDGSLSTYYRFSALQHYGLSLAKKGDNGTALKVLESAAGMHVDSRFANGHLHWAIAGLKLSPELYQKAVEQFGHQHILHASCCAIESVNRGLADQTETLMVLRELAESASPRTLRVLFEEALATSIECKRVSGLERAVRTAWLRWRTAQIRKFNRPV